MIAFAVWLISYTVEWSIRTDGKVSVGDALLGWWGDVVMLNWVERYQTLVAGILAVAAGAFAFAATVYQRRATLRDRADEQYAGAIATLYVMRGHFQRLILNGFKPDLNAMHGDMARIVDLLPSVTSISPGLADWLQFVVNEIGDGVNFVERNMHLRPDLAPDYSVGIASIAKCYLTDVERLFSSGRYKHVPRRLDPGDVAVLKTARVDLGKIGLAAGMVLPAD